MTMPETTQSDLVERLRTTKLLSQRNQMELQREAAAEIIRLRADSERLKKIESQTDGGGFDKWPTETFVGQLRMQARDNLDPEYSQFMTATATHLGLLAVQCDAQREIADRAKEDAARLRTQRDDAYAALRSLAEGNLGDLPWQANYQTVKLVASMAIPPEHRAVASAPGDPSPLSEITRLRAHCEAMAKALEVAERQIGAAFRIIYPGDDVGREVSLENVRKPLAAYRKESTHD